MADPILVETALVIIVPVLVGLAVVRLGRNRPATSVHPLRATLILFAALIVTIALLTPGGDLVTPTIGAIVSTMVSLGVFIELRRHMAAQTA